MRLLVVMIVIVANRRQTRGKLLIIDKPNFKEVRDIGTYISRQIEPALLPVAL